MNVAASADASAPCGGGGDVEDLMEPGDVVGVVDSNGHPVDKVELLVLGGTWASYPLEYREAFCRDLYYAANTFWQRADKRRRLLEEQTLNESAATKIIGLTLETRPDTIDEDEIRLLGYGCAACSSASSTPAAVLDRADQWKIYPCEVTPWTVIKKWFDEGSTCPTPRTRSWSY
ncbi:radical SAM domain containing protein [Aureococcus anophagefferens]|nr:radical SAM domain containing protein [Aureococcus anophagefferens]